MSGRVGVVLSFVVAEVLQLLYWLFVRFATLDHPERVEAAGRMQLLLGIGLIVLPIGFLACFGGSPAALRVAALCAAAALFAAAAVAVIGAVGFGGNDPLVGGLAVLMILAVPGLILIVCAWWRRP